MTLIQIIFLTCLLLLWNLFIIHFLTKWVYNFVLKYKGIPAEYIGRKIIHIFCGGIIALLIPVLYEGYYEFVILSAYGLGAYLLLWRHFRLLYWFQVKENMYEVHFTIAYGTSLLLGVLLQNIMIGLIPLLFMSFGDSVTGLVRAITQRKQVKSLDGSLAMLIVCSLIGFVFLGMYGIMLGVVATFVEKIPGIDDNITVPLVTVLLVYFYGIFL